MAVSGVTEYTSTYAAGRTNGSSGLSSGAQEYLGGLKEKYPDVSITVADFKNGKQEDAYMFACSGGNHVAVSAGILEKMAKDPAAAAKYEKVIAEAPEAAKEIEKGLAAHGAEMVAGGTVIGQDGKISYWCIGKHEPPNDSPAAAYKKALQEQLEEKRAKKKEEEALKEKRLARAESVERLLEKLRVEAEEPVKAKEEGKGTQLDLNI